MNPAPSTLHWSLRRSAHIRFPPPYVMPITAQSFRFLALPPELRDIVLQKCIDAGDLEIMRTSREIYHWSKDLLDRNGIFRLSFQEFDGEFSINPPVIPPQAIAVALNFEADVVLGLGSPVYLGEHDYTPDYLNPLTDQIVARKTCHFRLRCISDHGLRRVINIVSILKRFVGLELLTVEVIYYQNHSCWAVDLGPVPATSTTAYRGIMARTKNKPAYEVLIRGLESHLGPASWQDGCVQGGRYLEFRPKEFCRKMQKTAAGGGRAIMI